MIASCTCECPKKISTIRLSEHDRRSELSLSVVLYQFNETKLDVLAAHRKPVATNIYFQECTQAKAGNAASGIVTIDSQSMG